MVTPLKEVAVQRVSRPRLHGDLAGTGLECHGATGPASRMEPREAEGWRAFALCRGVGPELFFPVGDVGPDAVEHAEAAKAVCGACPVREPCLEFSLVTNQEFGVWGGLTQEERRRFRRARGRRPAGSVP